jgi:hypothetical protein
MKNLIIPILALAIWGCSGTGVMDLTLVNDGFRGITYTNVEGTIVGPIDTNDWTLSFGDTWNLMPRAHHAFDIDSVAAVIPTAFKVGPAYPNPTDGAFSMEIAFPAAGAYSIMVIDDNYRILGQLSGEAEAGVETINWVINEDVPSDIYRVLYNVNGLSGYGDVWIKGQ